MALQLFILEHRGGGFPLIRYHQRQRRAGARVGTCGRSCLLMSLGSRAKSASRAPTYRTLSWSDSVSML